MAQTATLLQAAVPLEPHLPSPPRLLPQAAPLYFHAISSPGVLCLFPSQKRFSCPPGTDRMLLCELRQSVSWSIITYAIVRTVNCTCQKPTQTSLNTESTRRPLRRSKVKLNQAEPKWRHQKSRFLSLSDLYSSAVA